MDGQEVQLVRLPHQSVRPGNKNVGTAIKGTLPNGIVLTCFDAGSSNVTARRAGACVRRKCAPLEMMEADNCRAWSETSPTHKRTQKAHNITKRGKKTETMWNLRPSLSSSWKVRPSTKRWMAPSASELTSSRLRKIAGEFGCKPTHASCAETTITQITHEGLSQNQQRCSITNQR